MSEGHVLVLLYYQRLNFYVMWLSRACNALTVTLENNVDMQMFSWQSDAWTFKNAIYTNLNKPPQ